MRPRLLAFQLAFKGSPPWKMGVRSFPSTRTRIMELMCRSCQRSFSASRILSQASKTAAKTVGKDRRYDSRLLVYDAGDARTTWISFWKAMALLQFGTTLVFGVPPLWNNENQPDPNIRKFQAVLVGVLGTIPTLTLAYVTAPFVHQVFLQIPEYARRSRQDLMHFARTFKANPKATANTKLEFVTLRIFPFRKTTAAFLHELRALPPMRMRLANIELAKTDEWAQRQRMKSTFKRFYEVISEPRFKFYVKEGRMYTMKTGVPGVWEEVANRIHNQTMAESVGTEKGGKTFKQPSVVQKSTKLLKKVDRETIKRQTSRPVFKD